jgi:hypothetical protein
MIDTLDEAAETVIRFGNRVSGDDLAHRDSLTAGGSNYADSLRNASGTQDFDDYFPASTTTLQADTVRVNESGTLRLEYAEANDANTGGETDTVAVIDANGIIKKGNHPLSDVGSGGGSGWPGGNGPVWSDADTLVWIMGHPIHEVATGVSWTEIFITYGYAVQLNDTGVQADGYFRWFVPRGLASRDSAEIIYFGIGELTGNSIITSAITSYGPGEIPHAGWDKEAIQYVAETDTVRSTISLTANTLFADTVEVALASPASTDQLTQLNTRMNADEAAHTAGDFRIYGVQVRIY